MTDTNDLLDFRWSDESENFFDSPVEKPTEEVKPEVKEEVKEEVKPEVEEFGDFSEEAEETKEPLGNVYSDVFKDLKEQGIFKHVELEEGEEMTPDRMLELQSMEYEAEVTERLKSWAASDLDEDAQAFIKFKRDGGDTAAFFETYKSLSEIPVGEIDDEDYQDEIIRYSLRQEGLDRDEIEDRLDYFTQSGKKEKYAEKYEKKVKIEESTRKENLLKQSENQKALAREQEESFKTTIKSTLETTDEISGFKFSKSEKTEILDLLTKKVHKVSDTKSVTGFQKKLSEVFQDPSKILLLAKILNNDFNVSDLKKEAVTEKVKVIKTNLEQRKNLVSNTTNKSLADLFN
jgi:hypothetical protein